MDPSTLIQGVAAGGPPVFSTLNTLLQNRANRKMAEYQFDRNVEMWNMQNKYNTPANQMQRFKDAGLNPNLIYGKGTAGNATTMPQYQAPKQEFNLSPPDVLSVLGMYQDVLNKKQQRDNMQAQEDAIRQSTANAGITNSILQQNLINRTLGNTEYAKTLEERIRGWSLKNLETFGRYQLQQQEIKNKQQQHSIFELQMPWYRKTGEFAEKGLNFKNQNFIQNILGGSFDWLGEQWNSLLNYSKSYKHNK